jgi:hypothetical protein
MGDRELYCRRSDAARRAAMAFVPTARGSDFEVSRILRPAHRRPDSYLLAQNSPTTRARGRQVEQAARGGAGRPGAAV